jgi:thiamine biosynthesis protein ThiC
MFVASIAINSCPTLRVTKIARRYNVAQVINLSLSRNYTYLFILRSKRSIIKKSKAPLSTLGVYKGTTKANKRKQSPKKLNPKTRKEHPRNSSQNKPN